MFLERAVPYLVYALLLYIRSNQLIQTPTHYLRTHLMS